MSSDKNSLILVDGSSYLFRAFYAMPPLTNRAGIPTGAIYGVINMLRKLMQEYPTERIAVVFDPKGKTVRHEWYPDYKANRGAMPDDLQVQVPLVLQAIQDMGLPLVIQERQEADDVLGTLAKQAQQQGLHVTISTGDKDLAQLVNDQVCLVNTMTNKTMDTQGVFEKFGVQPEQIIDYLTLMGDNVDNIPGVEKVGPKTAAKWLAQYTTLANLIAHADEIKGKVGENFRNFLPKVELTQKLVTINCDLELKVHVNDLVLQEPKKAELTELYKELEFNNWLTELGGNQSVKPTIDTYPVVTTRKACQAWIKQLTEVSHFAFDTETTSLDEMQAQLVGVSLAVASGEACYIPLMHDYAGAPLQLDRDWVLQQLRPIFNDTSKTMIGQNLKYDLKVLRNYDVHVANHLFDTMLASYVLDNARSHHDLDSLAMHYLNYQTTTFTDIAGKGAKQLTFNQIPLEDAAPYAAEDADITWQLYEKLSAELNHKPIHLKVFTEIDMRLLPVLVDMEYTGVLLDSEQLIAQSETLAKSIKVLEDEIYNLSGEEFNLSSPKQLQAVLFEKLQLPVIKKTSSGQPSTAEPVLQELSLQYPLPKLILEFRSLAKLKSTYTDKLPLQVDPNTHRIHTHYQQTITSTGRLSCKNPNLQNIPVRNAEGRKIRQAFIAGKDAVIVAADYSQVELRLMAHISQDPGLLTAFAQGQDVHTATAAEVFAVELDAVTPEQRRHAKAINFGLLYGMSSYGLAKQLGSSREQAQNYIDIYFTRYPKVQAYMQSTRELAAEQGYVETLLGRQLLVPGINSSNGIQRKAAERAAINAPLQGSAADIIKVAMININEWRGQQDFTINMLMQVHDELVFEIDKAHVDESVDSITHYMQEAIELTVPLLVSVGVGRNWDEAH